MDFAAGFGDGISGGITDWIREQLGINGAVDKCSSNYSSGDTVGTVSAIGLGVGRIAYAGAAKVSSIAASSGKAASTSRAQLRVAFGGGKSLRLPNLSKYGNDRALREAAGRTNPYVNATGAGLARAGANSASKNNECECE